MPGDRRIVPSHPEPATVRPPSPATTTPPRRSATVAWCLYDWANSAYPTVIATFVFAAYFTRGIAPDEIVATTAWGHAMAASGLLIALLAPVLGAVADQTGRRKPWLAGFTLVCITCSGLLWFAAPDPSWMLYALVLVALSNAAFELGMAFYNAMLPDVTRPERMGRVSGWAWGLGYAGGLLCLVIALKVFVQADPPPFGLDPAQAEPVRATVVLVAAWYALFAWPLFVFVPDRPRAATAGAVQVARKAARELWATLKALKQFGPVPRFLLAHMIYTDGLNTLFAFGGIYAAGTFGMSFSEIIVFGIAMNVSAGLGAVLFGWTDDRMGPKRTITIGLIGMSVFGASILVVRDVALFWPLALAMGLFFGPVQASSRSLMARLSPPEVRNELFGLYAVSGKVTAFLGPLVVAWATALADSQRVGMATILVFLLGGLWLLRTVPAGRDPALERVARGG